MLIISLASAYIIGEFLLKNLICRVRPCYLLPEINLILDVPKSFSFPSGQATTSFSSAWILFKMNKKLGLSALVLALVIGFSRVYLFAHFPTDILGSALIGILCAQITYMIYSKFSKRRGS